MRFERHLTVLAAVIAMGLCTLLGGCSDDSSSNISPEPQFDAFWGNVDLGYPLVGSTITLYGLDGTVIATVTDATGPYGGFFILNNDFPSDFNVEVTGGTLNGEPFEDHIRANIRGYNPEKHYNINHITNIVAAYLEKHPEFSLDDVKTKVDYYLDISEYYTLDEVIDFLDYYTVLFSPEKFNAAMVESVGDINFDVFTDLILQNMEQGNQWSFAADYEYFDPLETASSDREFRSIDPVLWGTLRAAGVVLGYVGDSSGDFFTILFQIETGAALERIQGMLQDVLKDLEDIKAQLKKLERMLEKIHDDQVKNVWTREWRNNLKNKYFAPINQHWENLYRWSKNFKMTKEAKQKKINKAAENIANTFHHTILIPIRDSVLGADGTKSIIDYFNDLLELYKKDNQSGYDENIDNLFVSIHNKLGIKQLQGYLLYAHAYKFVNKTNVGLEHFKKFMLGDMKKQVEIFVRNAERYIANHSFEHHPSPEEPGEQFYYKEFPCGNVNNTVLSMMDFLAEIMAPCFGFKDPDNYDFTANEGAVVVRIMHPVYIDGPYFQDGGRIIGIAQSQNPSWLKTKPDQVFQYNGQEINVNSFPVYSIVEYKGTDPWGIRVMWRMATAKMATNELAACDYVGDPNGEALKKSNPLSYWGEDTALKIGTFEPNNKLYGFFSTYTVPTVETSLMDIHKQYVSVDTASPVDSDHKLNVYVMNQEGRTQNLLLKYCGNNQYTISSAENPYHTFAPDVPGWFDTSDKAPFPARGYMIYARRTGQHQQWPMFGGIIRLGGPAAIKFMAPLGFSEWRMMAHPNAKPSNPMFFGTTVQPVSEYESWKLSILTPTRGGSPIFVFN